MLGKKRHPPIIVLAAPASGGPLVVQALSGHAAVYGLDDGGLFAEALRLLDALADHEPERGAARVQQILDGRKEGHGPGIELVTRGVPTVSADERAALLERIVASARTASGQGATVSMTRDMINASIQKLAADAGKRIPAVHARACAGRAPGVISLCPDASIVHSIRDGRAVALVQAGIAARPGGLRHWARAWLQQIEPLLAFEANHPERVVKTAYEDLLVQPETELARLCSALDLDPEPENMAAALDAVLGDEDRFAFGSDMLDGWQIVELEAELQPALALLGYRPAAELATVERMRAQAEAFEAMRAEADVLRARLVALGAPAGEPVTLSGTTGDAAEVDAMVQELMVLRNQAKLYEDALDELRQIRFRMRDQQYLSSEINALRWKSKRYDQLRAAASPILAIRRRLARLR
jgi:hypothetical protein